MLIHEYQVVGTPHYIYIYKIFIFYINYISYSNYTRTQRLKLFKQKVITMVVDIGTTVVVVNL